MSKIAVLFVALVACVAVIDARPRNHRRYRPLARYQQKPRYSPRPRYAQYSRQRSARLEADEEQVPDDVQAYLPPLEAPVADLPEVLDTPVEVAPEPVPALDEVPEDAADSVVRVLLVPQNPEPEPAQSPNFFPLRFGGVTGATVAVANSFSTGNGGKSESRAVAFGNPEAAARLLRRRRH